MSEYSGNYLYRLHRLPTVVEVDYIPESRSPLLLGRRSLRPKLNLPRPPDVGRSPVGLGAVYSGSKNY
jgi:hypothetical protein